MGTHGTFTPGQAFMDSTWSKAQQPNFDFGAAPFAKHIANLLCWWQVTLMCSASYYCRWTTQPLADHTVR